MTRVTFLIALVLCSVAEARVPSRKALIPSSPGVRGDITVPYLTNGATTLGVANGVAPKVISSPLLDEKPAPAFQNVYNLPFYGSRLGPSSAFLGATVRPPNNLRGNP